MESLIVSVSDLKKFTTIGKNIDEEILFPFLLISQQMYTLPVLGNALYDDVISRFDNNQLTGDTQTLYEEYLIPAIGYGAYYAAIPFINWHTSRNGLMTMSTDALTPASIEEFSLFSTKLDNLKDFYLKRLEDYLIENSDLFPLFRKSENPQQGGGSIYLGYKTKTKRNEYWDLDSDLI